jgi:tetratricopeptide (TPR) repeat protein
LLRHALTVLLLAAIPALATPAESGQLDGSPSLFTVMAAINAAGYRAEWSSPNNSPVRFAVQAELAKRNIPSLGALKEFFENHRKKNDRLELSQYISFALSCNGPPAFEIAMRDVEIPPDVMPLREFSHLLAAFAREANIEDLWKRSQPAMEQYIARYHEPVTDAVLEVNAYLRQMTSGFKNRRFQIFIELQAAPNQIQTRSYSDNYTIVVTPSPDLRTFDIRHAYLHYLLDPLATRNEEVLNRKKSLLDHALRAEGLGEAFKQDYMLLVTESLIKAVESRLDHKPGEIQEALRDGYILAPYFAEALPVYEKQETSMNLYYADMIKAIDLMKEDRRLTGVEFRKEGAAGAVVRMPAAAPEPVVTGAAKTLEEAERAYGSRQLEKAKQLFLKTLEGPGKRSVQASAYYGLARIALLEKDLDAAERLFQKSLDSEPEAFDKAWDLVYLGRLAIAADDRDKALEYFQSALQLEGATDKARQEAKQGLELAQKKRQ